MYIHVNMYVYISIYTYISVYTYVYCVNVYMYIHTGSASKSETECVSLYQAFTVNSR